MVLGTPLAGTTFGGATRAVQPGPVPPAAAGSFQFAETRAKGLAGRQTERSHSFVGKSSGVCHVFVLGAVRRSLHALARCPWRARGVGPRYAHVLGAPAPLGRPGVPWVPVRPARRRAPRSWNRLLVYVCLGVGRRHQILPVRYSYPRSRVRQWFRAGGALTSHSPVPPVPESIPRRLLVLGCFTALSCWWSTFAQDAACHTHTIALFQVHPANMAAVLVEGGEGVRA